MVEQNEVVLEVKQLVKTYAETNVVDQVSFALCSGSVRAVLGENGAGKSTLMKMLTGLVMPDGGTVTVNGEQVSFTSLNDAANAGICMVHQELHLVPEQSLIDNIMLVTPPQAKTLRRGSKQETQFVVNELARVGLLLDPHTKAKHLSAAQAQLLSIAKALVIGAQILILDEPTAALPPEEVELVLEVVESLKSRGHAILYISHHLDEVMRLADELTILRDGKLVGNYSKGELTRDQIVGLMVDRPVSLYHGRLADHSVKELMRVENLAGQFVSNLTFCLRAGEILGFAGLIGSGAHAASYLLAGAERALMGHIDINGERVQLDSVEQAVKKGITLVPEERKTQSIVPELTVHENIHLGREHCFSQWGCLDQKSMREKSRELVEQFDIRLHSIEQKISTLSGGNQQKVILARCMLVRPKVLILSDPTRGIDIAAKDDIHQLILQLAKEGMAIIIVSSEMEEVMALSHRVAVFAEGKMTGLLTEPDINAEAIMKLATPNR